MYKGDKRDRQEMHKRGGDDVIGRDREIRGDRKEMGNEVRMSYWRCR